MATADDGSSGKLASLIHMEIRFYLVQPGSRYKITSVRRGARSPEGGGVLCPPPPDTSMTVVINHSNQLSLSYSQKPTVSLPFNKLCKPNVNNTKYVSLIFKDNPFPRYIKHVATYICGLLV